MAIQTGPRTLVIATFVALSVGFLVGYWMAPRAEAPEPTTASAAPHSVGPSEYSQLGMQSLESGDYPTAERYFRRAAEMSPDDAGPRMDLAVTLMYQERWQEAQEELEAAEDLAPEAPEIYFLRGVVYRDGMRDSGRARAAWERFLAMVPSDSPQAGTVRGWLDGLETASGESAQ
jgi:tetratricopeptide (TPR) repeat protein